MNEWAYSLASAGVVSLISLVGVVTIMVGVRRLDRIIPLLISLAVGALFGDALVHLLPEAFEDSTSTALTSFYVLLGIFLFFLMERFLHWHHEHHERSINPVHPVAYINLVSDGVHNFLDGLIIGASYLVSVPIGVATTVAVALHEVPQEQGDFGILLHAGFTPRRALLMNFLSGVLAIVGVVISLLLGPNVGDYTAFMLPLTAGGFIYIAGSDLIPELHHERELYSSLAQFAMVMVGIGLMYLVLLLK
jgi:zinc and cadmium transporter